MSNIIIKPERLSGNSPRVEFTGSSSGTSKIVVGPQGGLEFTLDVPGQEYSFIGGPVSVESLSIDDNLTVEGDLTVNGTMTTVNTTNLEVKDAVIGLGFASGTVSVSPPADRGIIASLNVDDHVAFLWKNSDSEFALGRTQQSATGSLPVVLTSYSNLHVAHLQASIVTASLGFTGSLTKLVDGSDYLRAGANVVLTTGALGQVEIGVAGVAPNTAQYLTLAIDPNLDNERVFTAGTGLISNDGGAGGLFTVGINDGVVATISGSTFTGVVKFNAGLSGSLTRLTDGSDYLLAGKNITTVTGGLGSIEITANPGNVVDGIQYNSNGFFTANSNFTFAGGVVYLTGSLENGELTRASGPYSHAEGYLSTGSANYSHAEGYDTLASGLGSHSEGRENTASGLASHAEGILSIAGGAGAHAEGSGSIAMGEGAHSEGKLTSAPAEGSHAEGWVTITSGSWSHAEGKATITSGSWSHAEGVYTIARGEASHAEGSGSLATGVGSHAGGRSTTALGDFSHAGGVVTLASGYAASAIGSGSAALGNFSFAAGEYTHASGSAQVVFGKFNKPDNTDSLVVVGNGYSNEIRDDIFIINSGSVLVGSASLAPDTFFYVGTRPEATNSRFDGNVIVSGTFDVKNGNDTSVMSVNGSKVGINVVPSTFTLEVNGSFAATSKSFVIDHPTKPGWRLQHGSLEGPENGVYVRGRTSNLEINLPDYWQNLVDESSITVHITPLGNTTTYCVTHISLNKVVVHLDVADTEYCYLIQGSRKDHQFEIEFEYA